MNATVPASERLLRSPLELLGRVRRSTLVVLAYHDLCEGPGSGSWLRVPQGDFARQLKVLGEIGHFIHPEDLAHPAVLRRHRLNFLLTFDDGFVNSYRLAAPVLRESRVTARYFVSTGPLVGAEPFWFDQVLCPIERGHLTRLDLREHGLGCYRFPPVGSARRWDAIQGLLETLKLARADQGPRLNRLVADLQRLVPCQCRFSECPYRPLNEEELVRLSREVCCTLGSHGHGHEILTRLGAEALRDNLQQSRSILEALSGRPIDQLSYPNGNVDGRVMAAARQAGYTFGFGTRSGVVGGGGEPMHLPRVLVGGYDSVRGLIARLVRVLAVEALRHRGVFVRSE